MSILLDPVLDVGTRSFDFVRVMVARGYFVFCMQGDPRVAPQLMQGMAFIRKVLVPRHRAGLVTYTYELGDRNELVNVPAVDIVHVSNDVGVQQWACVRLDTEDAEAILEEWPGPIAREILVTGMPRHVTGYLSDWYERNDGRYTLRGSVS